VDKSHTFYLKYEKRLKYALIVIGILFIVIGISIDWLKAGLVEIADSYVMDDCCFCRIYIDLIKPLFIIIGCFLFFSLFFKKRIIILYEKCTTKPNIFLAILLILIFITLALIAYFPFNNHPYSMDEYNYLYQAEIFSQGKLFIETSEIFRPFKETYMIIKEHKLFSKYPPGFSLILSFGVLLNITGLINPLIATVTLIVLYLFVKSLLGPKYGLLSVILMSTTPYFLGYSASYYSHPTSLLLTTLIFFSVRKYELTSKNIYLFLLGIFSGYSFFTRPLDSFCVVVPSYLYLLYLLYKKKDLKKASYAIFTFIILFALFLTYNYILIGKISIATYPIVKGEFRIVDPQTVGFFENLGSILMDYIRNGVHCIPRLLLKYLLIYAAIFIPVFAVFGMFKFKSKWKWVLVLNFLMLILFYNFHRGLGWPLYGARYYYSGFVSLVILATMYFKHLIEKFQNRSRILYLLMFVLCVHVVFSVIAIKEYSYRSKTKLALIEDIKDKCQDNSIVILDIKMNNSDKPKCYREVTLLDLGSERRNMFMNTSRLITINDRHLDLDQIKSHFPNHSICYYDYSGLNKLLSYD